MPNSIARRAPRHGSTSRGLMILVTLFLLCAGTASASTLTVTTTHDSLATGDHVCSLREAIAAANAPGSHGDCGAVGNGPNTIVLGPHLYTLTIAPSGTDDDSSGDLDVQSTHPLVIVGRGRAETTISAAGLGDRVFDIAKGANVTMLGLSLSGGHAPDGAAGANAGVTGAQPGGPGADGGAILNAGTLEMIGAAVTNSTAGSGGGGGAGLLTGSPGAPGGSGGAGGAIFNSGTLALRAVAITGNRAGDGGSGGSGAVGLGAAGAGGGGGCCGAGGGVANAGGAVSITSSTIASNRSGSGGRGGSGGAAGGLSAAGPGGAGAAGSPGGGISSIGGTLSIANSTLASNVSGAGGSGGAGGAQLAGDTSGAAGGDGGAGGRGGAISLSAGARATLTSVTVAGNGVAGAGSAGSGGAGNPAGDTGAPGAAGLGGGVAADSSASISLRDTLLASDAGGNCAGPITDAGHDLSFGDASCPASFLSGDPKLTPLGDHGGPTATVGLGAGSAALNRVPDPGGGCPPTDERGVARPSGPACDVGAYEAAPPTVRTISASAITGRGAELNATVTPNSASAVVQFQYGPSTAYGSRTPARPVSGVQSLPFSISVAGLRPGTTYHYRIVAGSVDGVANGADQTFTTARAGSSVPRLARLRARPSRFKVAGRARRGRYGTTISYSDSLAARTTFVVLRVELVHRRRRLVRLGSFGHRDHWGLNRVSFSGHLGRLALGRGRYRLAATPRLGGRSGRTATMSFQVI